MQFRYVKSLDLLGVGAGLCSGLFVPPLLQQFNNFIIFFTPVQVPTISY